MYVCIYVCVYIHRSYIFIYSFPGGSVVEKFFLPIQEMWVWSLGLEDPPEKEMAGHFNILPWEIPWTEEPGRLQSMDLQRSQIQLRDWNNNSIYVCVYYIWVLYMCIYICSQLKKGCTRPVPPADGKESACNVGDQSLIPGLGRSPGEENGNPLQYSCLENPMNGGAGWLQSIGSQRVGHDWVTLLSLSLERCEFSFIWGKMSTTAWVASSQIAVRDYSKAAVGGSQYIRFWWMGSSIPWNTHFTKGFLLVMRIWCHREGI